MNRRAGAALHTAAMGLLPACSGYSMIFGTLKQPLSATGAFRKASAGSSDGVTTSSLKAVSGGTVVVVGVTPAVSSSESFST